jgi:hypothetical protein
MPKYGLLVVFAKIKLHIEITSAIKLIIIEITSTNIPL